MGLPGVKVGPLDPDRTADFGQVSAKNSARSLIRLHAQAYPVALVQALARKQDVARSEGLDIDEVSGYLAGLTLENGDPLVPAGAEIVGASVRGERDREQLLTFTYRVEGTGRTAKWFAPYSEADLPNSYADGTDRVRIEELRKRGVVAMEGGPAAGGRSASEEKLARENARLKEQIDELRNAQAPVDEEDAAAEEEHAEAVVTPEPEADELPEDEQAEADVPVAAEEPPFDGYDDVKAAELVKLVKADDTSDEERQAILDYEKTHQNRKSVVGATEVKLGERGAA